MHIFQNLHIYYCNPDTFDAPLIQSLILHFSLIHSFIFPSNLYTSHC